MRVAVLSIAGLMMLAPLGAQAADLVTVPISNNESLPLTDTAPGGLDWNGFYAGIYGVTQASPASGMQYGIGLDLGVNAQIEFILVGGEVAYHGLTGGAGSTSYVQAVGKLGVAATDDVILYAAAGAGTDLGPADETDALLGGGVEFAVTDDLSLRAQYLHGFPLSGANPKDQVSVGANFHF